MKRKAYTSLLFLFAVAVSLAVAQIADPQSDPFSDTGQTIVNGHEVPYVIHHLPPSSFPELPSAIANLVAQRGCLIPQTYEAHRPENVIHASLEHAGSQDWALLCSVKGTVSLLVFFASAPEQPMVLAKAPEIERLQAHTPSRTLGFNWGIDPATPGQVHDAQIGLEPRPPALTHDALADSVVDQKTIYRFYSKGKWTLVDLPE